jgi:hypothetical protein
MEHQNLIYLVILNDLNHFPNQLQSILIVLF